jgi:hypothetical protein
MLGRRPCMLATIRRAVVLQHYELLIRPTAGRKADLFMVLPYIRGEVGATSALGRRKTNLETQ